MVALMMAVSVVARGAEAPPSQSPDPEPQARAFDVDMPRQAVDDARQFVGPATIKLSGREGAYRWKRLAFGSDSVELRVSLVGSDGPCRVNVRLADSVEAIVDEWFATAAPAKEEHVATIPVDHADARLQIDSDCHAWTVRFDPVADTEPGYTIDERTYAVRGDTIDELESATQRIEGRWAAYTEWFIGWVYLTEPIADGCRVSEGQTWLRASITFPTWRQPDAADPTLVARWERFLDRLRTHELGHVTIALQGADAIDDRIDRGFDAPTCDAAREQAEAAAQAILERTNRRSARYDETTSHGATQGALLD